MKTKKIIAAILAMSTAGILISGCTGGDEQQGNVKLKYIMPGPGIQENSKAVWEEFNKKLGEKLPGITVDFEIIPLAEYKQKVMLMMSAREQIDILNNYGLDFATEVGNGTFTVMNDLLDEYGKDISKALPEWIWDYETIDGNIYGIPTYQMMGQTRCICFVKELADQYLDLEALRKAIDSSPQWSQEVYDILTKYCEDVKASGINFKSTSILNLKGLDTITGPYGVRYGDEGCEVVNVYANENSDVRYKTAREWMEKGYIRQDALSCTDEADYNGKIDGNLFWDEVYSPYQADILTEQYGVEIITVPYDVEPYIGMKALAGGTSITESSAYKKEAMQVLNLLQTDKELYNLLVFGIEGEDYTVESEGRIRTSYDSSPTANDSYGLYKWIVGNSSLAYNIQSEPDSYNTWAFEEVNNSPNRSYLMGFQADTTQITDMLSQVSSIVTQYLQPLNVGSVDDWEGNYNEFKKKLRIAGEEQIIEELQKQINEFLENNK